MEKEKAKRTENTKWWQRFEEGQRVHVLASPPARIFTDDDGVVVSIIGHWIGAEVLGSSPGSVMVRTFRTKDRQAARVNVDRAYAIRPMAA